MNNTRFKDGRLGIGKTPIFPLDVSGNTRIEGNLVLKGTIADASGIPIYFGRPGITSTDGSNNNYHIGINKATATDANFPLDVEGNVNINNGSLFINGGVAEFSNWTDIGETEDSGIYRNSKVAIGKTTANHILDVSGTVSIDGDILLNGTTMDPNPSVPALQDYTDTGPTWKDATIITTVASSSDAELSNQTLTNSINAKADKASPEFSGSVGIGKTADVNYALDVVGDINLTGALKLNGQTPTYSNWVVSGSDIYRDSGVTIGQNSVNNTSYKLYVNGDSHVQGTLSATTLDGNLEWSKIQNPPATIATSQSNAIVANTAKVSSQWTTNSNDIYYNTGNVGIGTTSPGEKLTISGGALKVITPDPTTNFKVLDFKNTNSYGIYALSNSVPSVGNTLEFKADDYNFGSGRTHDVLTLHPGGNVGIGTTSPETKLELNGDAELLRIKGTTRSWISFYKGTTYQGFFGQANSANDNIYLAALNGNIILQEYSGNVGIGTQSPKTKLHVKGGHLLITEGEKTKNECGGCINFIQ